MKQGQKLSILVKSKRKRFLGRDYITIVVMITLTLMLVVLTVPVIRKNAGLFLRQSLTRQPESLTELYFSDIQRIPTTYRTGEPIMVPFTIHNLENRDFHYNYIVYAGHFVPKAAISKVIGNDSYAFINAVLPAQDYGQRAQITVELVGRSEKIHFWVERLP